MPGRTKCPTCGRLYTTPDRVCASCGAAREQPAVAVASPPADYHAPPSAIFRPARASKALWTALIVLALGIIAAGVAIAIGVWSGP